MLPLSALRQQQQYQQKQRRRLLGGNYSTPAAAAAAAAAALARPSTAERTAAPPAYCLPLLRSPPPQPPPRHHPQQRAGHARCLLFPQPLAISPAGAGNDDSVPPFNPHGTRYDSTTYFGRFRNILCAIDPRTLFLSDSAVRASQDLLAEFDARGGTLPPGVTDADMWRAQQEVAAVIHPATGKPISPTIGRMSAFTFANIPTAMGMLMHGPTSVGAGVFWQWVNQTYNVVNNYANRSSAEVDTKVIAASYAVAVTSACSLAMGLGALGKRVPALAKVGLLVPYVATVAAGSSNVAFTRVNEMIDGIHVVDARGNDLGVSVKAGRSAVFNTIITRSMFLPVFPLLLPPTIMSLLTRFRVVTPKTPPAIAAEIAVIALSLGLGLPAALALQPQRMTLRVADLEPEFQGRVDPATGQPYEVVFANKGL